MGSANQTTHAPAPEAPFAWTDSERDAARLATEAVIASSGALAEAAGKLFFGAWPDAASATPAAAFAETQHRWSALGEAHSKLATAFTEAGLLSMSMFLAQQRRAVGAAPGVSPSTQADVTHGQVTARASVAPVPATAIPVQVEAYCLKCRAHRVIASPEPVQLDNGARALKGTCTVCGAKVMRLQKRSAANGAVPAKPPAA